MFLRPPLPESLESAMLIYRRESLDTVDGGPGFVPWVIKRGGRDRQVVKSYLPTVIIGWGSDGIDYNRD
jgi:hypothetical protein